MRRVLGDVLAGFGLFSIIIANLNARTAPNLPAVIGTFLPGLLLPIIGIAVSWRGASRGQLRPLLFPLPLGDRPAFKRPPRKGFHLGPRPLFGG